VRDRADDRDDEEDDARPWGRRRPAQRRRRRDDDDWDDEDRDGDPTIWGVAPVNTNTTAIVAGYLGLISVLVVPAPFALVLGVLALRQLRRNRKQDGYGRAIFAIVMGVVFTLVPLALLAAAAIGKL